MIVVNSYRYRSSSHGTFSRWICNDIGWDSFCLELPWKNNKQSLSCIPDDTYIVKIRYSNKYGYVFHLTNVEGRTWILIHSGNYAGDIEKGLKTHSEGCLLLGQKAGILEGQQAILNSRATVKRFMRTMNNQTFKLNIINLYKVA